MTSSLREALIAQGKIKPVAAREPITSGILFGQRGKPQIGDIRSTYVQNPTKTGDKKGEGKTTPSKKEPIMSNTTETKTETTTNHNKRGAAKHDSDVESIAMEALNKNLALIAAVESDSHRVAALTDSTIALQSLVQSEMAQIRNTVREASTVDNGIALASSVGFLSGAIGGGCAVHFGLKSNDALAIVGGTAMGGALGSTAASLGVKAKRGIARLLAKRALKAAAKKQ